MEYVWGIVAGLIWGVAIGLIKHLVCWGGKNTDVSRQANRYMAVGMVLNVVALLAAYFLCRLLPFSAEMALVGTALGLTICSQGLSLRMLRHKAAAQVQTTADPQSESEAD